MKANNQEGKSAEISIAHDLRDIGVVGNRIETDGKVETTITLQNLKQDELSGHSNYSSIKHIFALLASFCNIFCSLSARWIYLS